MPKRSRVSVAQVRTNRRKYASRRSKRYTRGGSRLVRAVRAASLRVAETKYRSYSEEARELYHNGGSALGGFWPVQTSNMLSTSQSNTQQGRNGDEVWPVGLSIKLWLSNKLDRPNVMYRILVIACPPDQATTAQPAGLMQGSIGNYMLDFVNTDKYNVKYQKIIKPFAGDYSLETGATNREHSTSHTFYLPLKKRGKLAYSADAGNLPKYQRDCLSLVVIAYDAAGTLTTNNIASMSFVYRFYFKDP